MKNWKASWRVKPSEWASFRERRDVWVPFPKCNHRPHYSSEAIRCSGEGVQVAIIFCYHRNYPLSLPAAPFIDEQRAHFTAQRCMDSLLRCSDGKCSPDRHDCQQLARDNKNEWLHQRLIDRPIRDNFDAALTFLWFRWRAVQTAEIRNPSACTRRGKYFSFCSTSWMEFCDGPFWWAHISDGTWQRGDR